ncbi:hypothetical protein [Dactylosporangium sp. CA-092794]|uniref:WD40/YVTN/BNR-like repeat-containing protein n=1 Tax=Dactylosporangium sp. CA-092794 TaxID=3239929 RepID=UPI003D903BA4
MSGLRTLFEELAGADGPPTRLRADEVYGAARRRLRRRQAAWTVTGVVAGGLALGLGLQGLRPVPAVPEPVQTGGGAGPVVSVAATDAEHLYAGVRTCGGDDCPARLIGSDDGGRTWTVRQEDFGDGEVDAPAPGVLLHTTESMGDPSGATGPKLIRHHHVSTDGGRTWRELQRVADPVAAVPGNGWLQCAPTSLDTPCKLLAVDPQTARMAPLSAQPGLDVNATDAAPASSGPWVIGISDTHQYALALTRDRGRTWSVHAFDEAGAVQVTAASADGVTAYAIVSKRTDTAEPGATAAPGPAAAVLRTTDGGATWQAVDPGHTLPSGTGYYMDGDAYLAADGSHVVLLRSDDRQRWFVSGDRGATYREARPSGLGEHITLSGQRPPVQTAVPGVYLAFDDRAAYRSTDGLSWTRIPIEPVR